MKNNITMIVAAATNHTIGKDNQLLWHISEDLKRFKALTSGHAIIMGRKTFESLPKALPNRTNIVITRKRDYSAPGAHVCHSLEEALEMASGDLQPFIIGGGEIYKQALPHTDTIELTRVHKTFEGDAFFPEISPLVWECVQESEKKQTASGLAYTFTTFKKTHRNR